MRLAAPIVGAELGWIAMGLVDIAMVGRLGPAAIGAVGVGSVLCFAVVVFGIGMLLGLDPLVARAHGRGRPDECRRWLVQGTCLALLLAVPLTLAAGAVAASLGVWGMDPEVRRLAAPYFTIVLLSVLPLLLYTALRRYLQAVGLAASRRHEQDDADTHEARHGNGREDLLAPVRQEQVDAEHDEGQRGEQELRDEKGEVVHPAPAMAPRSLATLSSMPLMNRNGSSPMSRMNAASSQDATASTLVMSSAGACPGPVEGSQRSPVAPKKTLATSLSMYTAVMAAPMTASAPSSG